MKYINNNLYLLFNIASYFYILIINILLMLLMTMSIAALTLIERKVLALIQRRVGPNFVGYKGRLQYIADALKLFLKGIAIPDESNKFWFVTIPSLALAMCYFFWINSVWGPNISVLEIEYNLVYSSLFSTLFGICTILTGYFSKNKYAVMSSVRTCILMLNLELFLGLLILNLVIFTESFCFSVFVLYQEIFWFFILFFGTLSLIIIIFLLETNRAPFDLSEAESELVAGYNVEYGGFYFGLFYLGEYFHLFFFSLTISILFFGGWEFPNFFLYFVINMYNFIFYFDLTLENFDDFVYIFRYLHLIKCVTLQFYHFLTIYYHLFIIYINTPTYLIIYCYSKYPYLKYRFVMYKLYFYKTSFFLFFYSYFHLIHLFFTIIKYNYLFPFVIYVSQLWLMKSPTYYVVYNRIRYYIAFFFFHWYFFYIFLYLFFFLFLFFLLYYINNFYDSFKAIFSLLGVLFKKLKTFMFLLYFNLKKCIFFTYRFCINLKKYF